jgi:hypothetical protein
MLNDDLPPRDGLFSKIKSSTAAQLWIVAAVAIAFFLTVKYLGIARDCGPAPRGGQCAFDSTLMQEFGLAGAFMIWIIASARILWAKSRREKAKRKKRAHDESFVDPEYDRGASMLLNRLEDDKRRAAEDRVRNRRA